MFVDELVVLCIDYNKGIQIMTPIFARLLSGESNAFHLHDSLACTGYVELIENSIGHQCGLSVMCA